jgi:hypothetical protein
MKTRKDARRPSPAPVEQPASSWLDEMHLHFQRTGAYRADDLQRVLGDPREGAEVEATTDFQFGAFLPKA